MPTRLRFEFYGDAQVDRTLERFSDHAADMRPAWDAMVDAFVRSERRQFATEGAHASGGWSPLSPRYAAWKARHYPGRSILEREGDLKASLTERPLGVEFLTRRLAVFGSDVFYGAFHQAGAGRLPRRRPVELRESLRREFVQIAQRYIVTGSPTRTRRTRSSVST